MKKILFTLLLLQCISIFSMKVESINTNQIQCNFLLTSTDIDKEIPKRTPVWKMRIAEEALKVKNSTQFSPAEVKLELIDEKYQIILKQTPSNKRGKITTIEHKISIKDLISLRKENVLNKQDNIVFYQLRDENGNLLSPPTYSKITKQELFNCLTEYKKVQPTVSKVKFLQRTVIGLSSFCLALLLFIIYQQYH